ncbi:MAG TPA: hypothetical protein VHB46_18430 [Burkholderiales bacterium]|nr:hypothetical protein [Burkholderiales bacterium]
MKILSGISAAFLISSTAGCGSGDGSSAPAAPTAPQTTLSVSVPSLALAVSGQTVYTSSSIQPPLPTGKPRTFTVTNTGSNTATGLGVMPSAVFPLGTSISSNTCGSALAAGASCTVTVTPGSGTTHTAGVTSITPVTVSIAGSNTNTATVSVSVLTYGSVYQGGYVFALDDTTADTGSVGGAVAALTDQSAAVAWGPNGSSIGGISETSTASSSSCDGKSDGACNTARIKSVSGSDYSSYAASQCDGTISGYADWYLPAICELGYTAVNASQDCLSQVSPLVQNMRSSLIDTTGSGVAFSEYSWSSTELAVGPSFAAWIESFGGSYNGNIDIGKAITSSVRCARKLTN